MMSCIPIIDVFAGPGGLGEGFCALGRYQNKRLFQIGVSVEKEPSAHSTLLLRSFYRQFDQATVPTEYYKFIKGDLSRDELFELYPEQAAAAKSEAWLDALGSGEQFDKKLDERIAMVTSGHDKWVLIGGPPCQAYSLIGRSRNNAKKDYRLEDDEKSSLYIQYLRIIAKHQPPVFVMENVKGLLSAKADGASLFKRILSDLQSPAEVFPDIGNKRSLKYKIYSMVKHPDELSGKAPSPEDYIVRCEDYGVPQARHRVILLGVREDLASIPPNVLKKCKPVNAEEVLEGLPKLRSGLSRERDNEDAWLQRITATLQQAWVLNAADNYGKDFDGRLKRVVLSPTRFHYGRGNDRFLPYLTRLDKNLRWWYFDPRLEGVCNHASRSHIYEDLQRYLFAACYAQGGISPKLREFPAELLPKHKNAMSGHFDDRFRVQVYGRPSTTITSHISKDGHYYIHPDPSQCRTLTVREAARLQTFPDNYFFCGNRTQQYVQVGNAVPPLLAYKLAEIVYDFFVKVCPND